MPEPAEPPSTADRALARAIRALGVAPEPIWARFDPSRRDRLALAWASAERSSPEETWDRLRRDHGASSRPDLARVHPSWLARALVGESPAVRRMVASHVAIRSTLDLDYETGEFNADPEAVRWALSLWSERLVGDVAEVDDDPPVVAAIARLPARDLARLVRVAGLAKLAFALAGPEGRAIDLARLARFSAADRVRLGFFRRHIGRPDPRLVPIARLDLEAAEGDRKRGLARIGLLTFGRLMATVEPHRARWALQHLPYPIAKLIRTGATRRASIAWEAWVLEAAWARLLREGHLATPPVGGFAP